MWSAPLPRCVGQYGSPFYRLLIRSARESIYSRSASKCTFQLLRVLLTSKFKTIFFPILKFKTVNI